MQSLITSINKFSENNSLKITLNLISDVSNDKFDNKIEKIIKFKNIELKFYKSKIKGNRGTYLECCDLAENAEDLIFFIEDDYLFEPNCIEEMIFTYSRLSTLFKNDIFLCPSDYPFYYRLRIFNIYLYWT